MSVAHQVVSDFRKYTKTVQPWGSVINFISASSDYYCRLQDIAPPEVVINRNVRDNAYHS